MTPPTPPTSPLARRHLLWGWGALFLFATVGMGLETLHGFKIGFYLDVGNETRRLVWTLAHTHGVLLGLINVAAALCLRAWPDAEARWRGGSALLLAGTALMPAGFLLGGIWIHGGDPGLGVLLVPPGALCTVASLALALRAFRGTA